MLLLDFRYHNGITDESKNPTTAWKRDELITWLAARGVVYNFTVEKVLKTEMLATAKLMQIPKVYLTDHLAENCGKDVKVLRLPIGHCELNPIELIWAEVKRKIADQNKTFKIKDVNELAKAIIDDVTAESWQNTIEHVLRVEQDYWKFDQLVDEIDAEQLIFEDDIADINIENEGNCFDTFEHLGLDPM